MPPFRKRQRRPIFWEGDLAFPDELIECRLWDLQVGRQLFDDQYIIWFFIHQARLIGLTYCSIRNISELAHNLQLVAIVVERFSESNELLRM